MIRSISTTNQTLLPLINRMSKPGKAASQVFKREVVGRILAFAVPFFRAADALGNCGIALGESVAFLGLSAVKPLGRVLRGIGIDRLPMNICSSQLIKEHFKAAGNAVTQDPGLFFHLMANPAYSEKIIMRQKTSSPLSVPKDPVDQMIEIDHRRIATEQLQTRTPDELDRDWSMKDFAGHIYVINLDDRPDPNKGGAIGDTHKKRFKQVTENLKAIGIEETQFERLPATYGKYDLDKSYWDRMIDYSLYFDKAKQLKAHQAQTGLLMSHYRALKDASTRYNEAKTEFEAAKTSFKNAKDDGAKTEAKKQLEAAAAKVKEYSRVLVLEDDNGFGLVSKKDRKTPAEASLKGAGTKFRQAMQELPDDWDMLYLMAIECERGSALWFNPMNKYTEHLDRLNYGTCTNAVMFNVSSKGFERILKSLEEIQNPKKKLKPTDHLYATLHNRVKAFVPYPPLAYQGPGTSTITEGTLEEPWNGTWNRGF